MENNIKKTILIEAKECIEMGKISKTGRTYRYIRMAQYI